MKQSTLSFATISADDAVGQQETWAQQFALEHPTVTAQGTTIPRPVGRPKKRPLELAQPDENVEPKQSRGNYTNWFSSPYINDILREYRRCGFNARRTVMTLRADSPDDRYARLSHTTILGWHDSNHKLLPHFQIQYNIGQAAARSTGRPAALAKNSELENKIKECLLKMRSAGAPVNSHIIRLIIRVFILEEDPTIMNKICLSQAWISHWVRTVVGWTWRARTTAASKLPNDWESRGIEMAKRLAATIQTYNVHPSLVVNLDQTGVHLIPSSQWTYEQKNSSEVGVVGAEDKRQITAVLSSSLFGDLLPLQLIFQGKTSRSLPPTTTESIAARVHLTQTENHWSSIETMKQYINEIIIPYAERCIRQFQLRSDAEIVLLLDVWSVHTSEAFRMFMRTYHPRIHLVFVPPNCTKKLQPADVGLQRPFKEGIRRRFNEWCANILREQIQKDEVVGLGEYFKMNVLKPLILKWCVQSGNELGMDKSIISGAWYKAVVSLFDVHDPQKRLEALQLVAKKELEMVHVPEEVEQDADSESEIIESDHEEDEEEDELDLTQPVREGTRKSERNKKSSVPFGYQIDASKLMFTSDSDR